MLKVILAIMASDHLHESNLSAQTIDTHRAIVSLMEELEAVDWYQQRAEACTDPELRAILLHNKNEEIEHAMMVLEWLRRKDPVVAANVAKYIGTQGSITELEHEAEATSSSSSSSSSFSSSSSSSLGVGSLKGKR